MTDRDPQERLIGIVGMLIAELGLYWCGLHYGQRFLALLCRLSFSPDFCVRQTETVFAKVGPWSLLFAKFFPGLSTISVAMAGVIKMSLPVFLSLNGIGALLFVSVPVVLGWIFQNAITDILAGPGGAASVRALAITRTRSNL